MLRPGSRVSLSTARWRRAGNVLKGFEVAAEDLLARLGEAEPGPWSAAHSAFVDLRLQGAPVVSGRYDNWR